MSHKADNHARDFAVEVVQRLRDAGYQALWAGGCVRDGLLSRKPKDYDVATDARPEQIREVFGHRKTIAIGAAFGVITVLGGKQRGQIEVATFRCDAEYSDGRRPDSVRFSTPEEDAARRDFTINGLFYDPLKEQVIDFVGGRDDLQQGIVRAIGNPAERIAEDKLRMLRAVRFAATFGFEIEENTLAAVQRHAEEITIVSAERIAAEMRRMLAHPQCQLAAKLLVESGLLAQILPEVETAQQTSSQAETTTWQQTLSMLEQVVEPGFEVALALMIRAATDSTTARMALAKKVAARWKLTNDESKSLAWLLEQEDLIRNASTVPWPTLQRVLIESGIKLLLQYAAAVAFVLDGNLQAIDYCQARLAWPSEKLNPPPLLTGDDLKAAGLRPGPAFKSLLVAVRDAQLDGEISDRRQALDLVQQLSAGS